MPTLTAQVVANKFFDNVICRFGGVQKIVSDNGSCFVGEAFQLMCQKYKITQSFSSVAHPQTSGLVERTNRTLLNIFRNFANEKQNNWDEGLPELLFSINTAEAYSLGVSPFLLCHGYEPLNPVECNVKLDLQGDGTVLDRFSGILQTQKAAHETSREKFKKTQEGMKARYDKSAYDPKIRPGDRVWLFWPRIKDNTTKLKLAKVFHGPYLVVDYHTDATVWLKHAVTGHFLTKPVTVHRLKKGMDRKELENKWPTFDKVYIDPEPLSCGDLPTDSFLPPEPQMGDLDNGYENIDDEDVESIHSDSEVDDPTSDHDSPDLDNTFPENSLSGTNIPLAKKTKDGLFHSIKQVEKINKQGPDIILLVEYQDGEKAWVPESFLNKKAIETYLSGDLEVPFLHYPLRNRLKNV